MNEEEKAYVPSLTLEPNAQAVAEAAEEKKEEVQEEIPIERPELEKLSPAEQAAVKEFAKKIDILNTEQVLNYGSNAQKNISEFSDSALNAVRTKDLGEVGTMLSDLVVELKGMNFLDGATTRLRNRQIGGHAAEQPTPASSRDWSSTPSNSTSHPELMTETDIATCDQDGGDDL